MFRIDNCVIRPIDAPVTIIEYTLEKPRDSGMRVWCSETTERCGGQAVGYLSANDDKTLYAARPEDMDSLTLEYTRLRFRYDLIAAKSELSQAKMALEYAQKRVALAVAAHKKVLMRNPDKARTNPEGDRIYETPRNERHDR